MISADSARKTERSELDHGGGGRRERTVSESVKLGIASHASSSPPLEGSGRREKRQ